MQERVPVCLGFGDIRPSGFETRHLTSPDSAEYGSKSLSPMPVETGQMKACTGVVELVCWLSRRRSCSARNDDAVVPVGSIESGGATCRIELVLVSTS